MTGGGFKKDQAPQYSALDFDRCAISFLPFQTPVTTKDGIVFDILNIVPYIKERGTHPTTGEKLTIKQLIRLNFHKNTDGAFCCPITYKVFTKHSHIVFVKPTGNVFSMEAIEELNVRAKYWKDLVSSEPFEKKDIIDIQDPNNVVKRDIKQFDHVVNEKNRQKRQRTKKNRGKRRGG